MHKKLSTPVRVLTFFATMLLVAIASSLSTPPAQAAATEIVLEYVVTDTTPVTGDAFVQVGLGGDLVGVTINWEAGRTSTIDDGTGVPTAFYGYQFESAGTKTVTISATTLTRLGHCGEVPKSLRNFKKIVSWSSTTLTSLQCLANFREGLTSVPATLPNANITDLSSAFYQASSFNQNLNSWNTSAVTDMSNLFLGTAFTNNDNALTWNTSAVINMTAMFAFTRFNKPLPFDTSKVAGMSYMFTGNSVFNQDISAWNTSSLAATEAMFAQATAFNQSLNGWNTSNIFNSSDMFSGATAFNGDITDWNMGKAQYVNGMFNGATAFNQDISTWDMSKAKNMSYMFTNATSFNQNISAWNTSQADNTSSMFAGATIFNQPIGKWDVSSVTSMNEMFLDATAFNQPLADWKVSKVADFNNWLQRSGLDNTNYSQLLVAWSKLPVKPNLTFGAQTNQAVGCPAITARTTLKSAPNNWTFNDVVPGDGCSGPSPTPAEPVLANTGSPINAALPLAYGGIALGIALLLVLVRRKIS